MTTSILTVIIIIAVMTLVGLFFGLVLAVANKKLAVEQNPLVHEVEEILPKGQCGNCGFAGCQAYAEAVVNNSDVPPDLCIPGKEEVAKKVAEITGKKSNPLEERVAFVKCRQPITSASKKFEYAGIHDCVAASLLHGGMKGCSYGCLGFGTCVGNCPFGAITMNAEGLPVVDQLLCTGCGKCAESCPKHIIEVIPVGTKVNVVCSSKERGVPAKEHCPSACIACGLCVKNCPHGAVKMVDNLPVFERSICMSECTEAVCAMKCPMKAIEIRN